MIDKRYVRIFHEYFEGQYDEFEEIFQILKNNGASISDCVKILVLELKLPLKMADEIVLNSKTWGGLKNGSQELRREFLLLIKKNKGKYDL